MRIKLYILLSVLLLSAASCNRKVTAAISHTTLHQDSSSTAIDTTKYTYTETTKETTDFGDTLTTKIIVPFDVKEASPTPPKEGLKKVAKPFPIFVESNGITILGSFTAKEDGTGFDLDLKAIAKPKSTTKETTTTANENKGVATNNTNKINLEQEDKNKVIYKEDVFAKWVGLSLLGLGILLLIAYTIYLYIKNKNNGKIC